MDSPKLIVNGGNLYTSRADIVDKLLKDYFREDPILLVEHSGGDHDTINHQRKVQMKTITEKTTIVLTLEGGVWHANWSGPESAKAKELFGTGKIPTPFRANAKPEEVLESIQKLNPEYQVSISPESQSMEAKVCDALKARGVVCHLEYQDWINIPVGEHHHWAFGTINETWDGGFTKDSDTIDAVQLLFKNDHQSDGNDIADAILKAITAFDYAKHGAPYVFDSVSADRKAFATPVPYSIGYTRKDHIVIDASDRVVAHVMSTSSDEPVGDEERKTAEFIVKACNSHEKLERALKLIAINLRLANTQDNLTGYAKLALDAAHKALE